MTLKNPNPLIHKKSSKNFAVLCPCGEVFIPDGRGNRVFCDACRIKKHNHNSIVYQAQLRRREASFRDFWQLIQIETSPYKPRITTENLSAKLASIDQKLKPTRLF